jgi:hypothetical protein
MEAVIAMNYALLRWLWPAALGLFAYGCLTPDERTIGQHIYERESTDGDESRDRNNRFLEGKVDQLNGSCAQGDELVCGEYSGDDCWCDLLCAEYYDCCHDVAETCGLDECTDDGAGCPTGSSCQIDPIDDEPNNCVQKPQPKPLLECGGFFGTTCPEGLQCVDHPTDGCDPNNGGSDCAGICLDGPLIECGGFLGLQCPNGKTCVDLPADGCNPHNGGSDCSGLCIT